MEDKTVIKTAPPPPSEVKIRTMRSDINSMMQSGGGAPSFENVSVSGLSMDTKFKPSTFVQTPMPTADAMPASTFATQALEEASAAAPSEPASRPILGEEVADAGPNGDLIPKLIVGLVALVAIAVVGYVAYTIFTK